MGLVGMAATLRPQPGMAAVAELADGVAPRPLEMAEMVAMLATVVHIRGRMGGMAALVVVRLAAAAAKVATEVMVSVEAQEGTPETAEMVVQPQAETAAPVGMAEMATLREEAVAVDRPERELMAQGAWRVHLAHPTGTPVARVEMEAPHLELPANLDLAATIVQVAERHSQ